MDSAQVSPSGQSARREAMPPNGQQSPGIPVAPSTARQDDSEGEDENLVSHMPLEQHRHPALVRSAVKSHCSRFPPRKNGRVRAWLLDCINTAADSSMAFTRPASHGAGSPSTPTRKRNRSQQFELSSDIIKFNFASEAPQSPLPPPVEEASLVVYFGLVARIDAAPGKSHHQSKPDPADVEFLPLQGPQLPGHAAKF